MQCPHCHDAPLGATRLEDGLIGQGCAHCEGVLVSLLHYRDWAERSAGGLTDDAPQRWSRCLITRVRWPAPSARG